MIHHILKPNYMNSTPPLLYSKRGCNYQRGLFPSESIVRVYGNDSNKSFRGL